MQQIALVALGGACGALLRFAVGSALAAAGARGFPLATLTVNVTGSFAIGLAFVILAERSPAGAEAWRALLVVGFLGAFTTFSAFSIETLNLLEAGKPLQAAANVLANVVLCLAACAIGMVAARP